MRHLVAVVLSVALSAGGVCAQGRLSVQGTPFFGGDLTLSVDAPAGIGQAVFLAVGVNPLPLDAPVVTGKGPFFVGTMLQSLALGGIPAGGRLDLPITMPGEVPALVGIPIVVQGYLGGQLTNPATVPLDQPYFTDAAAKVITSPEPVAGALFGDRTAWGDLNGDGVADIIVGAWFEDWAGLTNSGRAYVLWGPDFTGYVALSSPLPTKFAGFGGGLAVADLDNDSIDDLIVGEVVDPDVPTDTGTLYVYWGGPSFSSTPGKALQSPETGLDAGIFGRFPATGDFNGDGWTDIAEGMYSAQVGGVPFAGKVVVLWGPLFTTRTILTSAAPELGDVFGRPVVVGDCTGDGIEDVIVGNGGDDVSGVLNQGSIHVFAGPNLTFQTRIDNPYPGVPFAYFGDYLYCADFTGDGIADVLTCDSLDRAFLFIAPTFDEFIEIDKPFSVDSNPAIGFFGYMLDSGDANGDGMRDAFIGDPIEGSTAGCADQATGTLFIALAPYYSTLFRLGDMVGSCGSAFADTGGTAAGLDADGRVELIVGGYSSDWGGMQNAGHITVFDDAWLVPQP